MNIAEHMDAAFAPIWILDPFDPLDLDVVDLRPGRLIPVRSIDSVRLVGGNPPCWERVRRMIEGPDA
jgi:hypothetical protein